MSADWAVKFDTYEYNDTCGVTLESMTEPMAVKLRTADTPGRNMAYTAGGVLAPLRFDIKGLIQGSSASEFRTRVWAFRAAHAPGTGKKFYTHSDVYRWAECEAIGGMEFGQMARNYARFSATFYCADPLQYGTTPVSTTGLASGGTVTNAGQAPTAPTFTLVVGSTGSSGTIIIGNSTTGQTMTITPDATGTFTINCYNETVTRSSVERPATFSGEYLRLNAGNNTITVSTTSSATVTTLACSHLPAYY